MSTILFIGRKPTDFSLFWIISGLLCILISFTAAAIYLGQSVLSRTSTSTMSSIFIFLSVSKYISGIFNGFLSTVATSLAIPSTLLQSDLFAVTLISRTISSFPNTTLISVPNGYFSLFIIKIPYAPAPEYSSSVSFNSSPEHNIPFEATPRNLPFLITWPVGNKELSNATGTRSHSDTFCAPVTIWTSSVSPTSIWHICNLSASGCFSSFIILPSTTFFILALASIISSTSKPAPTSLSASSSTLTSISTKSFNQLNETFISALLFKFL